MARKEAVQVARKLFDEHNGHCWHIGMVAIRQLLDAIYGGPPNTQQERLMRNMSPRVLDVRDAQRVAATRTQRVNSTVQINETAQCQCDSCRLLWAETIARAHKG